MLTKKNKIGCRSTGRAYSKWIRLANKSTFQLIHLQNVSPSKYIISEEGKLNNKSFLFVSEGSKYQLLMYFELNFL